MMGSQFSTPVEVMCLGQSGFRLRCGRRIVYIDPYLSNRVAEEEGPDHARLVPPPILPGNVTDADFVLITHLHKDHCDPATLLPLADASPQCRFVCPNEVALYLADLGVAAARMIPAAQEWITLAGGLRVMPIPAAHAAIEFDNAGWLRFVGFVLEFAGRRIYHSGDTSPHDDIFRALAPLRPIDVAFLPVNEANFFRSRRGIIGNMSVREAFAMAAELGVSKLVPMHWDMFAPNSVFPEEIELLYERMQPPFRLCLRPSEL